MARARRGFGAIRKLPSGRFQASFIGPDSRRHNAPTTFAARMDAEAWLSRRREEIRDGVWTPRPADAAPVPTLTDYAAKWLPARELKPSTRSHYRRLLERHVLPDLGQWRVNALTPDVVRAWHKAFPADIPTMRAHAYALLRTILTTAVEDGHLTANPCTIKGAGRVKRASVTRLLSLAELDSLVDLMPDRFKAATLVAAWGGLRFGELFALERRDVDTTAGVVRVRRAISRVDGQVIVGTPKSDAGRRDVHLPPHIMEAVRHQLDTYALPGREGLVFPAERGGYLNPATMQHPFYRAREAIGREDFRWHDLRHFGATEAARAGATLRELMARMGHSTTGASLRYQHAAAERDAEIARRLSERAGAD